jgi:hypothetical protein
MNPTGLVRCASCRCLTTAVEARLRNVNTGRCGVCGGELVPLHDLKPACAEFSYAVAA